MNRSELNKEAIKYINNAGFGKGTNITIHGLKCMMVDFYVDTQVKNLALSDVSHRREMLIGWEKIQMCDNWAKQKQKRIEAIDYYLASN
jgi:hypothetical protein